MNPALPPKASTCQLEAKVTTLLGLVSSLVSISLSGFPSILPQRPPVRFHKLSLTSTCTNC